MSGSGIIRAAWDCTSVPADIIVRRPSLVQRPEQSALKLTLQLSCHGAGEVLVTDRPLDKGTGAVDDPLG